MLPFYTEAAFEDRFLTLKLRLKSPLFTWQRKPPEPPEAALGSPTRVLNPSLLPLQRYTPTPELYNPNPQTLQP